MTIQAQTRGLGEFAPSEIKKGKEIGKKSHGIFIWAACNICGKERWVRFVKGQPVSKHCQNPACFSIATQTQVQGLGEIKTGKELGKGNRTNRYAWATCEGCGKERWVRLAYGGLRNKLCPSCAASLAMKGRNTQGKNNPNWKGGQRKMGKYIYVYAPDHPHTDYNRCVKQARLVLEERLGRDLLLGMDSHHSNEIKDDDRPENLEELTHSEHTSLHLRLRHLRLRRGG